MPKLDKYLKKGEPNPIDDVTDEKAQKHIVSALNAIEGFTALSQIALGLLQICAIRFANIDFGIFRWLRTRSSQIVSEATVACFMRKTIFLVFHAFPFLPIVQIIKNKQSNTASFFDSSVIIEQTIPSTQ